MAFFLSLDYFGAILFSVLLEPRALFLNLSSAGVGLELGTTSAFPKRVSKWRPKRLLAFL